MFVARNFCHKTTYPLPVWQCQTCYSGVMTWWQLVRTCLYLWSVCWWASCALQDTLVCSRTPITGFGCSLSCHMLVCFLSYGLLVCLYNICHVQVCSLSIFVYVLCHVISCVLLCFIAGISFNVSLLVNLKICHFQIYSLPCYILMSYNKWY